MTRLLIRRHVRDGKRIVGGRADWEVRLSQLRLDLIVDQRQFEQRFVDRIQQAVRIDRLLDVVGNTRFMIPRDDIGQLPLGHVHDWHIVAVGNRAQFSDH